MKKILAASAALALLGGSAALAQQDQGDHHRGGGQGAQGSQGGQAQAQGGQRGAAPANPSVQSGRPDWNAYFRNNPDLQRNYQSNKTREPAYSETQQAYAQRHYLEHGQKEGRALPMLPNAPVYGQGQSNAPVYGQGQQRWTGQGQNRWNGQDLNRGRGQGQERWSGQNQNRWTGDNRYRGENDRAWRGQLRQYQHNWQAERRFRFGFYERPRGWYYRRWTFGEFLPQLFWSQNYWIYDYADFNLPYPPPGCVWVRYGDDALLIDRYTGEIVQVIYGIFY